MMASWYHRIAWQRELSDSLFIILLAKKPCLLLQAAGIGDD